MNCGSGGDFALGQTSGPKGETVHTPFFKLGLAVWSVDSLMPLLPWNAFLDYPYQELISILTELGEHLI